MNYIKRIFKKHLVCILSIFFLIIFAVTVRVFANGWPYAPGATLNPGCGPTDEDCIVEIPSNYWSKAGDTGTYVIPTAFGVAGSVLTDAAGNGALSWAVGGGSSGWGLLGNAGTVDGTNFIGTTDDNPLNFRVNNEKAGRVDTEFFNTYYG